MGSGRAGGLDIAKGVDLLRECRLRRTARCIHMDVVGSIGTVGQQLVGLGRRKCRPGVGPVGLGHVETRRRAGVGAVHVHRGPGSGSHGHVGRVGHVKAASGAPLLPALQFAPPVVIEPLSMPSIDIPTGARGTRHRHASRAARRRGRGGWIRGSEEEIRGIRLHRLPIGPGVGGRAVRVATPMASDLTPPWAPWRRPGR